MFRDVHACIAEEVSDDAEGDAPRKVGFVVIGAGNADRFGEKPNLEPVGEFDGKGKDEATLDLAAADCSIGGDLQEG